MKNLFLLFALTAGILTMHSQNTMTQPAPSKKNASISKNEKKVDPNVKIAGSGEAIVMPSMNVENTAGVNKIPDGMYGSSRSGNVYSTSNPNYPYDKKGKIIQTKNSQIIRSKGGKSSYNGSSSMIVNTSNQAASTSASTMPATKSVETPSKK